MFDERQVTSKANRSTIELNQECHTLNGTAPTIASRTAQTSANGIGVQEELAHTLDGRQEAVAFAIQERAVSESETSGPQGKGWQQEQAFTLEARTRCQAVAKTGVRRLLPVECERLQGFADGHTEFDENGKLIADSPRYRMLGNAVSVPPVLWIAKRIMKVMSEDEQ